MKTNEHPCIEQVAEGNSPEDLPCILGDYVSGCDYVCARRIGDKACKHFFRHDPPDESGVMHKQESNEQCEQDISDDLQHALAEKARRRHFGKLQRKNMRGVLRTIARGTKKYEKLLVADASNNVVNEIEVVADESTETGLRIASSIPSYAEMHEIASQRYIAAQQRDSGLWPDNGDYVSDDDTQTIERFYA